MTRKNTIKIRQGKVKEAFLEQLKRTPTIETSCQKVSVSRATVYRWINASKGFKKKVGESLTEGREFMLDVAETQLFSLIGEKEMPAIRLYLSTHSPRYGNKLEIKGNIKQELTTAEKKLLKEALKRGELDND